MVVVIASENKGKIAEFDRILRPLGFDVISRKSAGMNKNIEETGIYQSIREDKAGLNFSYYLPLFFDEVASFYDMNNFNVGRYNPNTQSYNINNNMNNNNLNNNNMNNENFNNGNLNNGNFNNGNYNDNFNNGNGNFGNNGNENLYQQLL